MHKSKMVCPLCMSHEMCVLVSERVSDLSKLYKRAFNLDVKNYFSGSKYLDFCECSHCGLRFFYPLVCGDEAFYNTLQKFDWYYLDDKSEYAVAAKYAPPVGTVLEVGSGKGAFTKYLKGLDYVGLEASIKAKEMALKEGVRIENELVQDHALEYPGYYDMVCAFQVLEHVSDVCSFVQSCIDCLKSSGILIFAVPAEDSFLRYIKNNALNMPPHHVTRWSDRALESLGKLFDLQLISIVSESVQHYHYHWFRSVELIGCRGDNGKLLDLSLAFRIRRKINAMLANLLYPTYPDTVFLPRGHTVVAIYKKK